MQGEDRYPPRPFVARLAGKPCRPCYPPDEYFPAGVAPAQVPDTGYIPSAKDWPEDKTCYRPQSLPYPINSPVQPPCEPIEPPGCGIPKTFSSEQTKDFPYCPELERLRGRTCSGGKGSPPTQPCASPKKRVHFADSTAPPASHDETYKNMAPTSKECPCPDGKYSTPPQPYSQANGVPQYSNTSAPDYSSQPQSYGQANGVPQYTSTSVPDYSRDPIPPMHPDTRQKECVNAHYVPQQTLPTNGNGKLTACYRPMPEEPYPSVSPQQPCYCFPPSGTIEQMPPEGPPCYLPQPEDAYPLPNVTSAEGQDEQKMGPIGPWATGRPDWGPLAGMTGTRPVVDRYSITRYSDGEWRKHNEDVLKDAAKERHQADLTDFNSRRCMEMTAASTDKSQADNTERLRQRAQEVNHWKTELERAINAMAEEINLLELQRQRLKNSMGVMRVPEAIAGECLERRTARLEPDLVRDQAEEELIKEVALTSEVRDLMNRLLSQMEEQLKHNKAVKQRLEMDWSDKKEAHEIEAININLKNTSPTILFKPGATRFPDGQSTPESWVNSTKENLGLLEAERMKSEDLRSYLDKILTDVTRDLRMQADRVDLALANKIAVTDECRLRLEKDLVQILRRISDTEKLIKDLKQAIRNHDMAMKKAQTRLSNRLLRPRAENCRDRPQYGLVDEVKTIMENVAAQKAMLQQAEDTLKEMIRVRGNLEREIMVKKKTLQIDRDRCQEIRSHYPSSTALSGY